MPVRRARRLGEAGAEIPGGVRRTDPQTSVAAALASPGRRASIRVQLLGVYAEAWPEELTAYEAALEMGWDEARFRASSLWTRCSELERMGWLVVTGTGLMPSTQKEVLRFRLAGRAAYHEYRRRYEEER